jgi:hypothetical protein
MMMGTIVTRLNKKITLLDIFLNDRWLWVRLVFGLTLFIVVYSFTRLPFFIYYPLPIIGPDSVGYYSQVAALEAGKLPNFGVRPPGFILFVWLCRLFSHDPMFIVLTQCLITLMTIMGVTAVIATHHPKLALPLILALTLYTGSTMTLMWDVSLLSDSLYVNLMMWSLTGLFVGMTRRHNGYASFGAFMAIWAVMVRPNGLFLLVVFLLAALWALVRYRIFKFAFAFVLPILLVTGLLFGYNRINTGMTGFSCLQEGKLFVWTSIAIQPDPTLAPEINAAIEAKNKLIPPNDRAAIFTATYWELYPFELAFMRTAEITIPIMRKAIGADDADCARSYVNTAALQNQINQIGIRQHPEIYLKFILAVARNYFLSMGYNYWGDMYSWVPAMQYKDTFVEKAPAVAQIQAMGDFYDMQKPIGFQTINDPSGIKVNAPQPALTQSFYQFLTLRNTLFQRTGWAWVLLISLVIGLFLFLRSWGHSANGLFLLLLVACIIGNMLICIFGVSHADKRYTYSTEFIIYALIFCLPVALLAWVRNLS